MRRSMPLITLLLATAACQSADNDQPSARSQADRTEEVVTGAPPEAELPTDYRASPQAGPDIHPSAAPEVAFDYRYGFRLEAEKIAQLQQEHQRLCERYSESRCQITGMIYRAESEDDVEAMLSFRLDPAIAARFGREGVESALNAGGELSESQIEGEDVGKAIEQARRELPRLEAELDRIEASLRANPGAEEKARLEYDAQRLRQQIRDSRSERDVAERSVATTPMLFRYGSGSLAPGFARTPTVSEALEAAGDDFVASVNLLLVVLVRLLPWTTLGLLAWALMRFVRRRLRRTSAAALTEASA